MKLAGAMVNAEIRDFRKMSLELCQMVDEFRIRQMGEEEIEKDRAEKVPASQKKKKLGL